MNIVSNLPRLGQDQDIAFSLWVESKAGQELNVAAFAVEEAVFSLTRIEVMLAASGSEINLENLIGQKVTLTIQHRPRANERHFSGIIVEAESGESGGYGGRARILILPVLYRLETSPRFRIFENLSVPDIVRKIFAEHEITDVIWQLTNKHEPKRYCLQYRESDFAFINRLMGDAGIHYHFNHRTEGRHQMVIDDQSPMLLDCPGQAQLEYIAGAPANTKGIFCSSLSRRLKMRADTKYSLLNKAAIRASSSMDILQKPARATDPVKPDIIEVTGIANAPHLTPGYGVTVNRHPAMGMNIKWRLNSVRHEGVQRQPWKQSALDKNTGPLYGIEDSGSYGLTGLRFSKPFLKSPGLLQRALHDQAAGKSSGQVTAPLLGNFAQTADYSCAFDAIDYKLPFQPPIANRPTVDGPQNVRVLAVKRGEHDVKDDHLVQVRFLWDNEVDADNRDSICWVGFAPSMDVGAADLPVEGDTIIVEFFGGDPDRPVIIARSSAMGGRNRINSASVSEALSRSLVQSLDAALQQGLSEDLAENPFGDTGEKSTKTSEPDHSAPDHFTDDRKVVLDKSEERRIGKGRVIHVGETQNEYIVRDLIVETGKRIKEHVGSSRIVDIERHKREDIKGSYELNCGGKYLCKTVNLTMDIGDKLVIRGPGGRIAIDDKSITLESPNIRLKGKVTHEEPVRRRLEGIKAAMHNELPFAGKSESPKGDRRKKTSTKQ